MKIVWFSEIKWDYLTTRKQQLINRKPPDVELLYLEPYVRGRTNLFSLRKEGNIHCATVPFIKAAPVNPWKILLENSAIRRAVSLNARSQITSHLKKLGFEGGQAGFVISNIYAIDAVLRLRRLFLLYDCNDAHDSFPGMPAWTRDYFVRTCTKADAVVATSDILMETVSRLRAEGGAVRIGNGVDYDHFASTDDTIKARAATKEFTLGYIGAVAPWLDFDLLYIVASRHPEWKMVIAGPILGEARKELLRLAELQNVTYLEPVSYSEVPGLLHRMHLGLIPFRFNQLTRGVNPNKLYEYMASGLPVVATSFSPEVQVHPEVIRAAGGVGDFLQACEDMAGMVTKESKALELAAKARAIARANDWQEIADNFWAHVRNLMTGNPVTGTV